MRVLDITSFFAEGCGGIRTYYQEKARHLPPLGIDCHFAIPGASPSSSAFGGGTLHHLPGTPLFGSRFYHRFTSLASIIDLVRRLAPDVIEIGSHYILPDLVHRAIAALPRRPALVGFYHADFPRTYVAPTVGRVPLLGGLAIAASWALVAHHHRRYRATLFASRHVASALAAHRIPNLRWVGLGVDTETFRPATSRPAPSRHASSRLAPSRHAPRIVYAGRLGSDKGFALLLAAAPHIHAATGATFAIAGDGPLAPALAAAAARAPYLEALGVIHDRAALATVLASADLVIAPGEHETFSLAAAEALACATPVLGADRGGNRELCDDTDSPTFTAGSASSLASSAIAFLRRPAAVRAAIGARGRAHITSTYAWPTVARRIADVYAAHA